MKKAWPVIVIAVILGAALAYYFVNKNSSSSNNTGTNTSTPAPTPMTPPTTETPAPSGNEQGSTNPAPSTAQKVAIADMAFSPATITVKKGTTVTWTNQDSVAHTVTENDGQDGPKSSNLANGQSYSFTYNTVGTFKYHCTIHPNMTGTVTVTE